MSEHEFPSPPDDEAGPPDPSRVAIGLALGQSAASGEASDFLRAQRQLAELQLRHLRLQMEGLHEDRELAHRHMALRYFGDRLRIGLQLLAIAFGLTAVIVLAAMVWQAHEDHGLVIQGFSDPQSYIARGLSGQVLAEDLMSRLAAIRRKAIGGSLSDVADVRREEADALKVDIPGAGVSLDDVQRLLRRWLGHEVPLTADLREDGEGRASIDLRLAGADPITVSGPAADLDTLLQQAAERAFAAFDPENDVIYLFEANRPLEAVAAAERNALTATTPLERANAWSLWANVEGDPRRALARALVAIRSDPASMNGWREAADASQRLGHDQSALRLYRALLTTRRGDQLPRQRNSYGWVIGHARWAIDRALGDFETGDFEVGDERRSLLENYLMRTEADYGRHDDAAGARDLAAAVAAGPQGAADDPQVLVAHWLGASARADWRAAEADAAALVALEEAVKAAATSPSEAVAAEERLATQCRPWLALAEAMDGQPAAASALIGTTPLDCALCVRVRGEAATANRDWDLADRWFALAAREEAELPAPWLAWGRSFLARGDATRAATMFAAAHARSARDVDPLEAWGEALIVRKHFEEAAAKFEAVDKLAHRWGRNQLLWGEALAALGRTGEARARFRAAAALDLSAADRARLANLLVH